MLYGHRIRPKKFLLLHQLKSREEKLFWLYQRADIAIDGTPTEGYLERHFGHLIPELDRHIEIAKREKEDFKRWKHR